MKITWIEDNNQFGITGEKGLVGRLKLPFFWCGYSAVNKEDTATPFLLSCKFPGIKSFRFKTLEECKKQAEKVLTWFITEITAE